MDSLDILRELVAIPSVNPMGRDVAGPEFLETRLSDWLVEFFRRLEVPWQRLEVSPGRSNVIARIERPGAKTTILLDAHQDTVPVEGMTVEPFQPAIREGRLYGRGACDVKGGMAAMLWAFARLARERPATAANVVMSCTCDEEFTATGARSLAKLWSTPAGAKSLVPSPPDVCVVAEPTDLNIVVAHRGAIRWKLRTKGRACHSSRPQEGVNAIYKMAEVLLCLDRYATELPQMAPHHPLCGSATISVGRISGGISVNTVPDECLIEIDRRVIPGEDPQLVIPHVTTYLRERLDVDFEMLPPWLDGATLSDHNNGAWADRLMRHITAVVGPREKQGAWYGTNGSRFAAVGVPSIVFGPGSIAQAHTKDEWIDIEQLRQAGEIYYCVCATGS
ncbi:MAG TPA: M20 family metallopeptidase [Planctomycetaceae bacterium]|nr:M20 family metallopeptidase [Planctomycetaceae bacterium]